MEEGWDILETNSRHKGHKRSKGRQQVGKSMEGIGVKEEEERFVLDEHEHERKLMQELEKGIMRSVCQLMAWVHLQLSVLPLW